MPEKPASNGITLWTRRLFGIACAAMFVALIVNEFLLDRGKDVPLSVLALLASCAVFSTDQAYAVVSGFLKLKGGSSNG
ncbi:MAG: hypothetical protein AAF264_04015 [Pseudomonadota bacterium]